jgi:CubicO group peptidase (beta-lactamase class C family)
MILMNSRLERLLIVMFFCMSFPAQEFAQGTPKPVATIAETSKVDAAKALQGFDQFVADQMKAWYVPGVAVLVVRDGEVLISKGFGYRDLARQLPVTPKTLFAIGSMTKSFTVGVLGNLVQEGKFDWDRPVRDYSPDFRLFDSVASERVTGRDMVSHRTGVPGADLLSYKSKLSRSEMVKRLRFIEPTRDLRSAFQYNNLMITAAGCIAESIAKSSWEDLVRKKIFEPLGMMDSTLSIADSQKSKDFALPYALVNGETTQIEFDDLTAIAPAGGINSNLDDMKQYLLMLMDKGQHEGRQVIPLSTWQQMQIPQMAISAPLSKYEPELGYDSYGMGLNITTYRGHLNVYHNGGLDGFISVLTYLPKENIGVVVLSNMNSTLIDDVIARNVFDRLLLLDQIPWTQRLFSHYGSLVERSRAIKAELPPDTGKPTAHPLADFAGTYENPAFGQMKFEAVGSGLELTYNDRTTLMRHVDYDVFEVVEGLTGFGFRMVGRKFQFQLNASGQVDGVSVPIMGNIAKPYFFSRVKAGAVN